MHIDENTVKKIGRLARLEIDNDKIPEIAKGLESILNWVDELNEVDTTSVEPLFSVHIEQMPVRQDQVTDGSAPNKILANAPESDLNMFVVPKVVE